MTIHLLRILIPLMLTAAPSATPTPSPDPWSQVRFLEGDWVGTAEGEPGIGTVHRSYQFILGYRFLQERNVSAYAPKQPNSGGELHEHWSIISYDKKRQRLVLRQFHQEGFVNQYVLDEGQSARNRLVFVSEGFENLDPRMPSRRSSSWRSRGKTSRPIRRTRSSGRGANRSIKSRHDEAAIA